MNLARVLLTAAVVFTTQALAHGGVIESPAVNCP